MNRRHVGALLVAVVVAFPVAHATTGLPGLDSSEPAETVLLSEGESLTLEATSNATVRGETPRSHGTELRLRLQSTDSEQPFMQQTTATVATDGSITGTFDLSGFSQEATFRLTVLDESGTELVNTTGTVVAPPDGWSSKDADSTRTSTTDEEPTKDEQNGTEPEPLDVQFSPPDEHESLQLEPATAQVVGGTTNLDPGTELVVRMRSAGENPFLISRAVNVGTDGSFQAAFDLSDVPSGTPYQVAVYYNGSRVANASGEIVDPTPQIALQYDGANVTFESAANQTIRGETDLPPGTELLVRVRSSGSSPFIKQTETTVQENGAFTASFNFSSVDPGTSFEVQIRHAGDSVATANGEVINGTGA